MPSLSDLGRPVDGGAMLSGAAMAAWSYPDSGLENYKPWLAERVPGVTVPNPLDAASFGAATWTEIIGRPAAGQPPSRPAIFRVTSSRSGPAQST